MASTLAAAALLWSAADTASAVGADAGNTVTNTASVVYTINSVVQLPVTSNDAEFVVDRLVDLTVTAIPVTYVSVTPNTNGPIRFTVTNTSNAALGFNLNAVNIATDPFTLAADDFDATTVTAVVDTGNLGVYEPGIDVATSIDTVAEDGAFDVWVVAAIPSGQANLDIAGVTLTATAREPGPGGLPLSEEVGLEDAMTMETVFGDGTGDTDADGDAAFSDSGAYQVASADVTIAKTETLLSDPINAGVNPRHIPGAVIEYTVTVTNGPGTVDATSLTISDVIPPDVTYVPGTIILDGGALTDIAADDAGEFSAGTVTVTVPLLAPGDDAVITFQVTVN